MIDELAGVSLPPSLRPLTTALLHHPRPHSSHSLSPSVLLEPSPYRQYFILQQLYAGHCSYCNTLEVSPDSRMSTSSRQPAAIPVSRAHQVAFAQSWANLGSKTTGRQSWPSKVWQLLSHTLKRTWKPTAAIVGIEVVGGGINWIILSTTPEHGVRLACYPVVRTIQIISDVVVLFVWLRSPMLGLVNSWGHHD